LSGVFRGIKAGTGKVVFNGAFNVSSLVDFGTDVVFEQGLVRGASANLAQVYRGNIILGYNQALDFGAFPATITLAAGKTISVVDTPILGAGTALVITPDVAGLTLGSRVVPAGLDETEVPIYRRTIELGTGVNTGIASFTGTLKVVSGGILRLPAAAGSPASVTLNTGRLAVEQDGTIEIVNVAGGGTSVITLEAGLITIGAGAVGTGTVRAQDGTVTFATAGITGTPGAKLLLVNEEGEDAATITHNGTNPFVLTSVDLALASGDVTGGTLVVSTGKILTLALGANPGKITFLDGTGDPLDTTAKSRIRGIGTVANFSSWAGADSVILTSTGLVDGDLISVSGGPTYPFTFTATGVDGVTLAPELGLNYTP
jgi:hypothetical protein